MRGRRGRAGAQGRASVDDGGRGTVASRGAAEGGGRWPAEDRRGEGRGGVRRGRGEERGGVRGAGDGRRWRGTGAGGGGRWPVAGEAVAGCVLSVRARVDRQQSEKRLSSRRPIALAKQHSCSPAVP